MFDTDEAPERADAWPQPGEVWSLWEMLRAYVHEFAVVERGLDSLAEQCPYDAQKAADFKKRNDGRLESGELQAALENIAALAAAKEGGG